MRTCSETTWARLGTKTHPAQVELHIRQPVMKMKNVLPQVRIEQEPARIKCDATRCWEEIGYKRALTFTQDNAQRGREAAFGYIAQVAYEGDMMGAPEKYTLSDCLGYYAAREWGTPDFNVACVPRSRVDIDVQAAELKMDWQMGKVALQVQPGEVRVKAASSPLATYLRQSPTAREGAMPRINVLG